MAQRQKDNKPKVEEEEQEDSSSEAEEGTEDALARAASSDEALSETAEGSEAGEGGEDADVAGQLGTERYVLAGFFASGLLGAYVIGRFIQELWTSASNKDWFSQSVPRLAAINDEDKSTYALLIGGLIALVTVIRTYRRADVREWTDEVASELSKVKWPTRKEVQNSTVIVIAASTVATVYLALLDRFWAFLTSLVYGDGS